MAGRLLAGAAFGLPVGLLVFLRTDERVLAGIIGVAVLVAVVVIALGLDLRHAGPGLDVAGGVLSGALTMSAGVNGPPLVFVLQARHFEPTRFRATITSVFFVLDIISVTVFAATGDLDGDVLLAVAVALPGLALGAATGVAAASAPRRPALPGPRAQPADRGRRARRSSVPSPAELIRISAARRRSGAGGPPARRGGRARGGDRRPSRRA